MMRQTTVTLGGKEHVIAELPSRKAAAWRQSLQNQIGGIADLIQTAPDTDISSGAALAHLVRSVGALLVGSTDIVIDLLFEYAPALEADRERIENECYDSELIAAFVEVVRLAYPFGELAGLMSRFASGAGNSRTLTN